ncbi:MAG: EFR1 family ferrodoxin [Thermoplasmata archaeon]
MVDGAVLYFSSTGNTEHAVRQLVLHLKGFGTGLIKKMNVIELTEASRGGAQEIERINTTLNESDFLVLAFPVHDFAPARNVLEIISKIKACSTTKPAFVLATHAGNPGRSLATATEALEAKNFDIKGGVDLLYPSSWVISAPKENDTLAREKFINKFESLQKREWRALRIKSFSTFITQYMDPRRGVEADLITEFVEYPYIHSTQMLVKLYDPNMALRFFSITVDMKKCNKCGICEKVCPSGRMKIANFPSPKGKCYGCYGCVNNCPENAVESYLTKGKMRYTRKRLGLD